jgi:hypothetical protein
MFLSTYFTQFYQFSLAMENFPENGPQEVFRCRVIKIDVIYLKMYRISRNVFVFRKPETSSCHSHKYLNHNPTTNNVLATSPYMYHTHVHVVKKILEYLWVTEHFPRSRSICARWMLIFCWMCFQGDRHIEKVEIRTKFEFNK